MASDFIYPARRGRETHEVCDYLLASGFPDCNVIVKLYGKFQVVQEIITEDRNPSE